MLALQVSIFSLILLNQKQGLRTHEALLTCYVCMRHKRMFLVKTPYVIFLSICQLPFSRHGSERCGQKRNPRAICGGPHLPYYPISLLRPCRTVLLETLSVLQSIMSKSWCNLERNAEQA